VWKLSFDATAGLVFGCESLVTSEIREAWLLLQFLVDGRTRQKLLFRRRHLAVVPPLGWSWGINKLRRHSLKISDFKELAVAIWERLGSAAQQLAPRAAQVRVLPPDLFSLVQGPQSQLRIRDVRDLMAGRGPGPALPGPETRAHTDGSAWVTNWHR